MRLRRDRIGTAGFTAQTFAGPIYAEMEPRASGGTCLHHVIQRWRNKFVRELGN
jgi:hypothetical protein